MTNDRVNIKEKGKSWEHIACCNIICLLGGGGGRRASELFDYFRRTQDEPYSLIACVNLCAHLLQVMSGIANYTH